MVFTELSANALSGTTGEPNTPLSVEPLKKPQRQQGGEILSKGWWEKMQSLNI